MIDDTRSTYPNHYHDPLHPEDSEDRTVGCRHTDASICAKNEMPNVCAFVRADGMCLAPPMSWPKQYRKLSGSSEKSSEPKPKKKSKPPKINL